MSIILSHQSKQSRLEMQHRTRPILRSWRQPRVLLEIEPIMKTNTRTSFAERFGSRLGRGWRSYARREGRVGGWLMARGVPAALAKALVWAFRLAVLAMVLYSGFWVATVCLGVVGAAWAARNLDLEEPETEWRMGHSGYGLYRGETRIDIGDSFEED